LPLIRRAAETLFPGVNRPGCEDDRLRPSRADAKGEWSYNLTLTYAFMYYTETYLILLAYLGDFA